MKALAALLLAAALSVQAQDVSYYNRGLLRQPSAAADLNYLGINTSGVPLILITQIVSTIVGGVIASSNYATIPQLNASSNSLLSQINSSSNVLYADLLSATSSIAGPAVDIVFSTNLTAYTNGHQVTVTETNAGGGGGGGGFTPGSVPGMVLWLVGSNGVHTASDGTGTPVNNSTILYWGDLSGSGNNVTNASGGPAWVQFGGPNAAPALHWTSSSGTTFSGPAGFANTQPQWVFCVMKLDSIPVAGRYTLFVENQGGNFASWMVFNGIGDHFVESPNQLFFCPQASWPTKWMLISVGFNGGSTIVRTNSVQAVTGNAGTTVKNGLYVGGNPGDSGYVGWIAETLAYNANLSLTQVSNVEYYLTTKYGGFPQ